MKTKTKDKYIFSDYMITIFVFGIVFTIIGLIRTILDFPKPENILEMFILTIDITISGIGGLAIGLYLASKFIKEFEK